MIRVAITLIILANLVCSCLAQSQPPLVNGPIGQIKKFTLLLITSDQPTQGERYLAAIIQNPQGELASVRQISYAKSVPYSAASVAVKHQDILSELRNSGGQLPVLSLIDDEGRRWGTWYGRSLPTNEYSISRAVQTVLAAGVRARQVAIAEGREVPNGPTNHVQYLNRNEAVALMGSGGFSGGWNQNGGLFNPQITPQIQVPGGGFDANLNTRATGTIDQETRNWLMAMLLLFGAIVLAAVYMHGRAITDRPEDVDE